MTPIVIPKLMAKLTSNGLADWPVAHLNPQILKCLSFDKGIYALNLFSNCNPMRLKWIN